MIRRKQDPDLISTPPVKEHPNNETKLDTKKKYTSERNARSTVRWNGYLTSEFIAA